MPDSACLIFNPVAGQGDSEQRLSIIRSILEPSVDLDIRLTTAEVGAEELARDAIADGAQAIIAAGGDGTISAVAGTLIDTNIPLGVLSCGTANSFASALNLPAGLEESCQVIVAGVTRSVDVAFCNGKPMILLVGVGFEAETVAAADRKAKNRFGALAYVLAGLKQLRRLKRFQAQIETDEQVFTVFATGVTVANAAPPTSILAQGPAGIIVDDGKLDLTILAAKNSMRTITALYDLLRTALRGIATQHNDIEYLRSKRIKVLTKPPQKVALDGEVIGETPIEVECVPKGLLVFSPPTQAHQPIERLEDLPGLDV